MLYTDGVTDEQRDGEEFGIEGLTRVLRSTVGRAPEEIAAAIEDAVVAFRPGEPADDLAVLVAGVID